MKKLSAGQCLAVVRRLCMSMPMASERPSHGSPTWFIGDKGPSFASFWDNHHDDGNVALICAAPDGAQAMLIDDDPEVYYRPAYVGSKGWIGVRVDRAPAADVARAIEHAYATIAAKKPRARK
jgi:hypothetical protein